MYVPDCIRIYSWRWNIPSIFTTKILRIYQYIANFYDIFRNKNVNVESFWQFYYSSSAYRLRLSTIFLYFWYWIVGFQIKASTQIKLIYFFDGLHSLKVFKFICQFIARNSRKYNVVGKYVTLCHIFTNHVGNKT